MKNKTVLIVIFVFLTIFTSISVLMIFTSRNILEIKKEAANYDYVIITTDDLKDSLSAFKNWKEDCGYSVITRTVSWIYGQYDGNDEPERIRNFLVDEYDEWNITYVLIVGDIDSVPMRYCYPDPALHNNDEWRIPTDYYYADLTGEWDTDKDGYYGEGYNYSIEKFDDIDFDEAEVYVGRLPLDNPALVDKICQRIILFEQNKDSWKQKVLLLGPIENFYYTENTWMDDSGYFMEQLRTNVFEPNGYNVTTMYEKEGIRPCPLNCDHALNEENVLNYWQEGYGIVCWGGHGFYNNSLRQVWTYDDGDGIPEEGESEIESYPFITLEDVANLDDDKPSIVFSISCNNAWPEKMDNLGSVLMTNGAVVFIGSSRINYLGTGNDVDGEWKGSAAICSNFFNYLIEEGQTCGEAIYNSKNFCYENDVWMSLLNIYGFNLYGDPSLSLVTHLS